LNGQKPVGVVVETGVEVVVAAAANRVTLHLAGHLRTVATVVVVVVVAVAAFETVVGVVAGTEVEAVAVVVESGEASGESNQEQREKELTRVSWMNNNSERERTGTSCIGSTGALLKGATEY